MNKCGDETSQSRNLVIICWSSVVAQLHHTQWGRLLYNPIIRVVGGKFCEWEIRRVCVTPSFFFCIHGKKMFLWVFYLGFFGVYMGCCFSTTRRSMRATQARAAPGVNVDQPAPKAASKLSHEARRSSEECVGSARIAPSQLRIVTIRHGLKVFVLILPCFGHFG